MKVNPDSPKPLDAIARKAMALRPEDRYATALELAADVEKWLSDEPVSCYQDPFFERLARWARQIGRRHHHARPKQRQPGGVVRLRRERRAQDKASVAQADGIAGVQVQPGEHKRVGD